MEFKDLQGSVHNFRDGKPKVVLLWGKNCGYSRRALDIMRELRAEFDSQSIEFIALFADGEPDTAEDPDVMQRVQQASTGISVVDIRQDPRLGPAVLFGMGIVGLGAQISIIEPSGRIHHVDAFKGTKDEIRSRASRTLSQVALLDSPSVP